VAILPITNFTLNLKGDLALICPSLVRHRQPEEEEEAVAKLTYFDPSLTQYLGWLIALPSANVQGNLTYGGQTFQVEGSGYHDHNWGTFDYNKVLDRWYWTRPDFGNYTLDAAVSIASGLYGYQPFTAFYLAKGNQVIFPAREVTE
jgi:hypothetical protein